MQEKDTCHCQGCETLQQVIDQAQQLVDATADKLDDGIQSARISLLEGLEETRWKAAEL